ncbi:MAG TPA: ImmA/IrrE family metallo-endopeptidase [Gemmataceae bacterium]|nr:ImmA/IrrE family metallo-endopeptidase [Gemmataceae bacterium]
MFARLRTVGFSRHYLTRVALPSWWDDALADNPAGYAQLLMILSRHLGLDLRSLQDDAAQPRLKDFGLCKYKKRAGTSDDDLLLSRVIATRAAQLAAAAVARPYTPLPSAADLRLSILEYAPWVGFEHLLDYCWGAGIPVLHVNLFPTGAKRPEGFTLRVAGRPVVVLCRDEKQPSWQLFILAHELGHVACGHIPENGAILDEKVQENEPDAEEKEADRYALELLTGRPTTCINASGRWPNAGELARMAAEFGKRNAVNPGHVVLNYAHSMKGLNFYPVARAALNLLDPEADAVAAVRDRLAENLDWERLPEDSSEFLMRMTRQEVDEP